MFSILERLYEDLLRLFSKVEPYNKLTIEIQLETNQTKYMLNQYQRLNGTRLRQLIVPASDVLTVSSDNNPKADLAAHASAYLYLLDRKSNQVEDTIPLYLYLLAFDNAGAVAFFPYGKDMFNRTDIDWTKSYIEYADNTIPNAQNGDVVQLIVVYQDCEP